MRYAFVGLGNLGARLARNLVRAGFELRVYDLDQRAARELETHGAVATGSAAEAAAGADALITCLPSPRASESVLTGGALEALPEGADWLEMSTTDVDTLARLSALASGHGVATLEVPVTGGVHRAETGDITLFAGGEAAVLERHRPALEVMGGALFHLGPLGSASTCKVISNLLCLVDLVATGEALLLARGAGLDLGETYRAIRASSGTSREFEEYAPRILDGSLDTGFTLGLACKDLGFVTDAGRRLGVPLDLTGRVQSLFDAARERYGADAWTPHVVRAMEEAAGFEARAEGFERTGSRRPVDVAGE